MATQTTDERTHRLAEALLEVAARRTVSHDFEGPLGDAMRLVYRNFVDLDTALERIRSAAATAQESAELASAAKSRFLANMSHELRTPLNAIIGYSEMIAEAAGEHGDEVIRQDASRILVAGRHLLAMVDGVLDLSRVESNRVQLRFEDVDLATLVEDVATTMEPRVRSAGCRLVVECGARPVLWSDPTKLRQVLFNLIGNAMKFTPQGSITVRLEMTSWSVSLVVSDTGVGIAPDRLDAIFEPFQREETMAHRPGFGLGLAITRSFCELLGGEIRVSSELGVGSSFEVLLPRPPPPLEVSQ